MKKRILALVLSVTLIVTSIPLFAFAAKVTGTVTNLDQTTEEYKYDSDLYELGTDYLKNPDGSDNKDKPFTIITRKEDGFIFYPDTAANNGLKDTFEGVTVNAGGNGLETSKAVTQYPIYPNGNYTITLDAFTSGDVTVEQEVIPTDIVLVIDQSDSMFTKDMKDENGNTITRQAAMKQAVDDFIDVVYESATTKTVTNDNGTTTKVPLDPAEYIDHRIAMVVYGTDVRANLGNTDFDKTKILTPFIEVTADTEYNNIQHTNMIGEHLSTNSYEDAKAYLKGLIDKLPTDENGDSDANGNTADDSRTPIHSGMEKANEILNSAKSDTTHNYDERNHIVVALTDGVPAYGKTEGGTHGETQWFNFDEDCANAAIKEAYKIKKTYGATVYSIGFTKNSKADVITGAKNIDGTDNAEVGAYWSAIASDSEIANRFMNFLSSNSTTADSLGADSTRNNNKISGWEITNKFDYDAKKQFYLTADNPEDLSNAFKHIASNVSSIAIDLPAQTQIRDFVSDYFQMPEGFNQENIKDNVKVFKVKATVVTETKDADGKVISTDYTWANSAENITDDVEIVIIYEKTETGENEGISVVGFDFNEHFVSSTGRDDPSTDAIENDYLGSKLVIQFNVQATDGFIGGNDVITNTASSGVFPPQKDEDGNIKVDENGDIIYDTADTFIPPDTNVVVKYDITTLDQTIYLGNQILLYKILELDGHQVSGILNEFVNIQFSIYEEGAIDPETGEFAQKIDGKIIHKDADRYYYMVDGDKVYTDTGGNYEIDGERLYYVTRDEYGNKVKDEIFIEPGGYYFELDDTTHTHVQLNDDQAQYYKGITKATFFIPAGLSAEDAGKLAINNNQAILPPETTDYDLRCFAVPNDENDSTQAYLAEQLNQESTSITVYVLQPLIKGHDVYVDFGTQLNIREDGMSPINWKTAQSDDVNQGNLYNANAPYAPSVYYVYKNLATGEYFKSQYKVDWNNDGKYSADEIESFTANTEVEQTTWDDLTVKYKVLENLDKSVVSEEMYEIVGIQTLSSEGKEHVAYWSMESEVFDRMAENDDSITYDNHINIYINRYDVDITKTVTTTASEWATYPQSFIFHVSQTAFDFTKDLGEGAQSNGQTVDHQGNAYDITYREPDTTEVVMQPSDFIETSTNSDGTINYTCTKTVKNLRASLETIVTEDEEWSWRYQLTDTSVDTIIPANESYDKDVILINNVTLSKDLELAQDSILATGSLLKVASETSEKLIVPEGSLLATDIVLSSDNKRELALNIISSEDIELAEGDSTIHEDSTLKAGTFFKAGTIFNKTILNNVSTIQYTDEEGEIKEIILPEGDYELKKDITLYGDDLVLTGEFILPGETIIKLGSYFNYGVNELADGTLIPSSCILANDTKLLGDIILSVGVILSRDTNITAGTKLAAGTILTPGTVLPESVDLTRYGILEADISESNVITVNYTHNLYITGYKNDTMDLDNNKDGINDSLTDITGDGVPDTQSFIYGDKNDDGYLDVDVLAPFATEDEAIAGNYNNFDIPFDLDNDGFIDLLINAADPDANGRRDITSCITKLTKNYFNGFYINEDGNIVEVVDNNEIMIYNRATNYFNGYYLEWDQSYNDNKGGYKVVGGNGGVFAVADTEQEFDLNAKKDYWLVSADGINPDGSAGSQTGVSNVKFVDNKGKNYVGTGKVIVGEPDNLEIFNRDSDSTTGDSDTGLDALPLYVRNTYRYVNSNSYVIFTVGSDNTNNGLGVVPEKGQIDTYFTNELKNNQWLSDDDVEANEFVNADKVPVNNGGNG